MSFRLVISIIAYASLLPTASEGFACTSKRTTTTSAASVSSNLHQCSRATKTKDSSRIIHHATREQNSLYSDLTDDGSDDYRTESNDLKNDKNYMHPSVNFHNDMRRVLETRADNAKESLTSMPSSSNFDRRNRPPILKDDIDGANRVMSMLRHMINIGAANEGTFQIALGALKDRGRMRWHADKGVVVCAADVVDEIYDDAWDCLSGKVSTKTCNLVLQIFSSCSTPRGNRLYGQKAQDILDEMESEGIVPSAESFLYVLNAWSWQQGNGGDKICAEMAEKNFQKLLEASPNDEMKLNAYQLLLEAWSKVRDADAPKNAERILEEMKKICTNIKADSSSMTTVLLPNSESYTNAILTWTKSNSPEKAHDLLNECIDYLEDFSDSLENGEKISSDMEPKLYAFNGVIAAWGRNGRIEKAEEVLKKANEMKVKYKNFSPDSFSYNSILNAYAKKDSDMQNNLTRMFEIIYFMEENKEEQPSISPNCFTYHCVMRVLARTDTETSSIKAVQIAEKMHHLWESGDKSLKPTNIFYNIAINKVAKSKGEINPRKALDILNLLKLSEFCDPDIISYTSVIECFSKTDDDATAAEQSLDLFNEALSIHQEYKDPKMMPNLRTYTMVIQSLSKKPTLDNLIKARALLTQLNDLYKRTNDSQLRPNAYPFNYLLNFAAFTIGTSDDKLKAFKIAANTYNDLRGSGLSPDSFTYAFWFKLCNNLLPEGSVRTKSITYAFEQCKKDGMVTEENLKRLLAGTPSNVLIELLDLKPGTSVATYRKLRLCDFPPSWSRNKKRIY